MTQESETSKSYIFRQQGTKTTNSDARVHKQTSAPSTGNPTNHESTRNFLSNTMPSHTVDPQTPMEYIVIILKVGRVSLCLV